MTKRPIFFFALKLLVSGLLLWLVLAKLDVASIQMRLSAADWRWSTAAVAISPCAVLLAAWRWRVLSLGLLSRGESIRYTWIGLFFGSIVPGAVGGDVAKGVSLAAQRTTARDVRLPMSIIVDKLVGFWVLLLLFLVVAPVVLGTHPNLVAGLRATIWATGLATVVGLFAGLAIALPRGSTWAAGVASRIPVAFLRRVAERVLGAIAVYRGHGPALRRAVAICILIHAVNAFALWLVLRSLAIPANGLFAATFYFSLSVLVSLPISISGVGVRDVLAATLFTAFGLNPESGVAFSWLLLGLNLPNALVGGAIQLWEIFRRPPAG